MLRHGRRAEGEGNLRCRQRPNLHLHLGQCHFNLPNCSFQRFKGPLIVSPTLTFPHLAQGSANSCLLWMPTQPGVQLQYPPKGTLPLTAVGSVKRSAHCAKSRLGFLAEQVEDALLALGLQDDEDGDGLQEGVPEDKPQIKVKRWVKQAQRPSNEKTHLAISQGTNTTQRHVPSLQVILLQACKGPKSMQALCRPMHSRKLISSSGAHARTQTHA